MGLTVSMALALACRWLTDTGALCDPGMKAEATDVSARRRSTNILLGLSINTHEDEWMNIM